MHDEVEPRDDQIDALQLLETCRLVGRLLESQSEALRKGDDDRLIAISHQIGLCLAVLNRTPEQTDEPLRARLHRELARVQERIDHSRRQWQRQLDSLRKSGSRLRDSRRLSHHFRTELRQARRSLFDRSA